MDNEVINFNTVESIDNREESKFKTEEFINVIKGTKKGLNFKSFNVMNISKLTKAIFSLVLVAGIAIGAYSTTRPKKVEVPQAKDEEVKQGVEEKYLSNQILVKFKKEQRTKVKEGLPEQTGVANIDKLNKKYKVKSFDKAVKSDKVKKDSEVGGWYVVEFPVEKKELTKKSSGTKRLEDAPSIEIDPSYGVVGEILIQKSIAEYNRLPEVEKAEPVSVVEAFNTPNDYLLNSTNVYSFGDLWGLKKIQAEEAWDISTGLDQIIVAVVDTGVDYNHPDLKDAILKDSTGKVVGYDYVNDDADPMDDHGHGTHCAGTIGAVGNNNPDHSTNTGTGLVGVNWKVKIMPVKFLSSAGSGTTIAGANSWYFAADHGARVISNSWGGGGSSTLLEDVAKELSARNIVNVAAAGNNSSSAYSFNPANIPEVITVAASSHTDTLSCYSNWGIKIDVMAPGGDMSSCTGGTDDAILSAKASSGGNNMCTVSKGNIVDNYYCLVRGTSMATPHVAGLSALILSKHPDWTSEEIRSTLRNSADKVTGYEWDEKIGFGRINALKALSVNNPPPVAKITSPLPPFENGVVTSSGKTLTLYGKATGRNDFQKYEIQISKLQKPLGGGAVESYNMSVARSYHTATKLNNGKVLIAGGNGFDTTYRYHSSTEIFDPSNNTFSAGPSMAQPRYTHTATLLNDGRVLLVGGYSLYMGGLISKAEIYDPNANTITQTGALNTLRAAHTATLLNDGKVLITGGITGTSQRIGLTSAEVFDPASGLFTKVGDLINPRGNHTAKLFNDGRVLVVGGESSYLKYSNSTETYDPNTKTFSTGPEMNVGRGYHSSATLSDGKVLIMGGWTADSTGTKMVPTQSTEIYNPSTNLITKGPDMQYARNDFPVVTLPDGRILVVGGGGGGSNIEVYDPQSNKFSIFANLTYPKESNHTATLLDNGKLLIVGGSTNIATSTVELVKTSGSSAVSYDWQTVYTGTNQVDNGKLGDININFDQGLYLARVLVTDMGSTSYDVLPFAVDNEVMAGWPIKSFGLSLARDLADIDGDGQDEIIHNRIYSIDAYEADGKLISGFPVYSSPYDDLFTESTYYDLDNDGKKEIILGLGERIAVIRGDGTFMTGWPVKFSLPDESYILSWGSTVAVGDATGDSQPEIFVSVKGVYSKTLYTFGFDIHGNVLPGWPIKKEGRYESRSYFYMDHLNSLIDLDGDNILDLVSTSRMSPYVYAWHGDGTPVAGWPFDTKHNGAADLTVGYSKQYGPIVSFYAWGQVFDPASNEKDDYCNLEEGYPCHLHVLNGNGISLPNWPLIQSNYTSRGGQLADLDGDGELELFRDEMRNVILYELDKTRLALINNFDAGSFRTVKINNKSTLALVGFGSAVDLPDSPRRFRLYDQSGLIVWEKIYGSTPTVSDIDNDGVLEILSGALGNLWLWKIPNTLHNKTEPEWTMMMHDANGSNNGSFEQTVLLPPSGLPTPTVRPTSTPVPTVVPSPVPTRTPTIAPTPTRTPTPTQPPSVKSTLTGSVRNAAMQTIISGAKVDVKSTLGGKATSVYTNSQGIYTIQVNPGSYTLTANASGYQRQTKSTSLTSGSTTTVNFELAPKKPGAAGAIQTITDFFANLLGI